MSDDIQKSDDMSDTHSKVNDPTNQIKGLSRRRFLAKAGLVSAPAVLTMVSKPALGAVCNISGFTSVSPSGVVRHEVQGCGGFSHGAWKKPDQGNGNGDGNRSHWYAAGIAPNPRNTGNPAYATSPGNPISAAPNVPSQDPPATLFSAVFTHVTDSRTFEEVIEDNGSFDQFAAQTLLNALYFGWGTGVEASKISPLDVVYLHEAYVKGWSSFTSESGNEINIDGIDVKAFFENTQH